MDRNERIRRAVFRAVDAVNELGTPDTRIEKDLGTRLMGNGGATDSMSIVNLIIETEQSVEEEFDVLINLSSEQAMDPENGPLVTLGALEAHVDELLREAGHGQ